jgi:hypothetical protein
MELMQQGGWNSQQMAKRYSNISAVHLANKMKLQLNVGGSNYKY